MTHEEVWGAIDKFASAQHITCSALARRGGLDPTAFNRSKRFSKEGKARWPSTHSIAKILSASGKNFSDFVEFLGRRGE